MTISKFLIAAAFAALSTGATAAPVYDNGAAGANSNRCAEDSFACTGSWVLYDNFSLAKNTNVTGISWTAYLYDGISDYMGVRAWIYSADPVFGGGQLLHTVGVQKNAAVKNNALSGNAYLVSLTGLDIDLAAGSYWLGMQNDTKKGYGTIACAVVCNTGNATQHGFNAKGNKVDYRFSIGHELAFSIDGAAIAAVPEPASLGLFAAGLFGAALMRRRKAAR